MTEALRGHPGMAVALSHQGASTHVAFRSGAIAPGAQRTTVDLGFGWTMRAFGEPVAVGIGDPRTR